MSLLLFPVMSGSTFSTSRENLTCLCVTQTSLPLLRSEDHCRRFDPVCEEAGRRDDPDRLLSQRVCPHRPAAFHGAAAAKVRPQPRTLHQLLLQRQRFLRLQ